jgi:hypothetical protein
VGLRRFTDELGHQVFEPINASFQHRFCHQERATFLLVPTSPSKV